MEWHLAQVNIGRLRARVDDPLIADFVAALDRINALADAAPGFVWRLQTEDGNATAIRPADDDELLAINLSVWESVEALADYVYRSAHVELMRRRREWFERFSTSYNWLLMNFTDGAAHWYIQAMPRLTTIAGFELGTGSMASIVDPAEAVERLRD